MIRLCVILLSTAALAFAETKIEPASGQSLFTLEYGGATDFSGLTWVKGDIYYAVSNRVQALFPLRIELNRANGRFRRDRPCACS
jgi:hypothetical protein